MYYSYYIVLRISSDLCAAYLYSFAAQTQILHAFAAPMQLVSATSFSLPPPLKNQWWRSHPDRLTSTVIPTVLPCPHRVQPTNQACQACPSKPFSNQNLTGESVHEPREREIMYVHMFRRNIYETIQSEHLHFPIFRLRTTPPGTPTPCPCYMESCQFHVHATSTAMDPYIFAAVTVAKSTPPRYETTHLILRRDSHHRHQQFLWSPVLT